MDIINKVSVILAFSILFIWIFRELLNIYLILRNGFRVNVNCWFCNNNTRVIYANKNCFDCPHCEQYNGFDKDGGYNKVIEAQHVSLKRSVTNYSKIQTNKYSLKLGSPKKLCNICNNNLQLKIYQLAKFKPLNEDNYDTEITHFQKQLEKAYNLCKICDKVVKSTTQKQNFRVEGHDIKKVQNSDDLFLNLTKTGITNENKKIIGVNFVEYALILCSASTFFYVVYMQFTEEECIGDYSHNFVSRILIFEIEDMKLKWSKSFHFHCNYLTVMSFIGFLLEISFATLDIFSLRKVNETFFWIIIFLTSFLSLNEKSSICLLQVFCSFWLMFSLISENFFNSTKTKKYTFKKFRKADVVDTNLTSLSIQKDQNRDKNGPVNEIYDIDNELANALNGLSLSDFKSKNLKTNHFSTSKFMKKKEK